MSWHLAAMVGFDTETTGVDVETARIVTATVVRVDGGVKDKREWLINPGVDIPAEATAVHGVTTEHARAAGDDPAAAVGEIMLALHNAWGEGLPVVAYNAAYDMTVLDRELRRHHGYGLDVRGPIIDPFCIDKALDPYRKGKRTLTASCAHYGVRLDAAHDASEDALAACRLAWRLAQVYPEQIGDLALVNDLQAVWRREWAVSFEQYLARQGKPERVDGAWPIRAAAVTS